MNNKKMYPLAKVGQMNGLIHVGQQLMPFHTMKTCMRGMKIIQVLNIIN